MPTFPEHRLTNKKSRNQEQAFVDQKQSNIEFSGPIGGRNIGSKNNLNSQNLVNVSKTSSKQQY